MTGIQSLLNFIDESQTAFQAVQSCCARLEANGFVRLQEGDAWKLEAGQGYYLTRNQSSVLAFRMPTEACESFMITASHTDSPTFKLKNECLAPTDRFLRLNTEVYGGTIFSTWMDRPLSLAGRAVLLHDGRFEAIPVVIDRDLLIIPNVAIHFNRSINSGFSYNPAVDMLPLLSMDMSVSVKGLLAQVLDCREEEIVGFDLFVYNRMKGTRVGAAEEFFAAPRIDNLMCVWGTLEGLLEAEASSHTVQLFFAADNEETGSATKQGAGSLMLSDAIDRICEATGADRRRVLASSMMVSADNAHAKHPNHPEMSDAKNAPTINGGVVIKNNAAQKYTTEALSYSIFSEICRKAGIPVQEFANRSDMAGGSTLGSISNTRVPLLTVDIGMAQLAMHSACETAGCADADHLKNAMRAFYESTLRADKDGCFHLDSMNVLKKENEHV